VKGAVVPQYFVLAGGGVEDGKARFASLVGKVPARRASEAVARLAALYAEERRHGERPSEFFGRALDRAKQAIAPLEALGDTEVGAEDLVEPGAPEPFRPDTQEGECAA
jgi:sulfite reductase beta subunit-like hemoprotein